VDFQEGFFNRFLSGPKLPKMDMIGIKENKGILAIVVEKYAITYPLNV
jgi:hypothetical protein